MNKQAADWFRYSRRDLLGAEFNLSGSDDLLPLAGFLAQQAVEKAIKGFLVAYKKKITKTHNIAFLLQGVAEVDKGLATAITEADDLTDLAVKYRYPDALLKELTRADVEHALRLAKITCDQILKAIQSK